MFDIYDLLGFLLAIALAAYWWRISGQKVQALKSAKNHCSRIGLQLLDETLVFKRYKIEKDGKGKIHLCRNYEFDFCTDGEKRYSGEIVLAGFSTVRIVLETEHIEVTEFNVYH